MASDFASLYPMVKGDVVYLCYDLASHTTCVGDVLMGSLEHLGVGPEREASTKDASRVEKAEVRRVELKKNIKLRYFVISLGRSPFTVPYLTFGDFHR